MAREFSRDERMWTGVTIVLAILTSLGISLAYRWAGLKQGSEWVPIMPIVACALIIVSIVSAFYDRKRRFVMQSPATWAIVVREKELDTFADDSSVRIPRLYLRYLPSEDGRVDMRRLHDPVHSLSTWVDLRGLSSDFERSVRPGDLVTVLYDTKNPSKLIVVEYEH
jgi:hypothetical protein